MGSPPIGPVPLYKEEVRMKRHMKGGRPCEDAENRAATSQGKKLWQKSPLLTSQPWSSSLQNCEKIQVCCFSHPACSTLYGNPSGLIEQGRPQRGSVGPLPEGGALC